MRLIIVEDSPADVRLFKEALRFSGITAELCHFADGVAAVASLGSDNEPWNPPPDLVFLDLNMPRVNGFEVLERLRSTPGCATIPVAIFTSSHSPHDVEKATVLGADRFVRKPTELREFFDVVASTIHQLSG